MGEDGKSETVREFLMRWDDDSCILLVLGGRYYHELYVYDTVHLAGVHQGPNQV